MQTIERLNVSQKWHKGFQRLLKDITEIVIHGTGGGGSADSLMKWMDGGERSEDYKKGIALFHFLIDFDGTVFQIAPLTSWYYHSSSGSHDKVSIGIETMNRDPQNKAEFTDAQYHSLVSLVLSILETVDIKDIVSHNYNKKKYSNGTKKCPGNFDWSRLFNLLGSADVKLEYTEDEHFKILE